ncbi:MAG: exodeoxyribonuclease VII large subunit [Candidatus Paceibacterota bacterium]
MAEGLVQKLKFWRDAQAQAEGVPYYMVLKNTTLLEISQAHIANTEDLAKISGLTANKISKYGKKILEIVLGASSTTADEQSHEDNKALPVSLFLDFVNGGLAQFKGRVLGEVSSAKVQGRAMYFTIKDKNDQSTLDCFIWLAQYEMCGVNMQVGMEVIVTGTPNIYKPSGRFSLRAETVELVGEGALKKAYDELKAKLEAEGIFALEKKRPLPEYPQKIGLITSKTGAVIHDFLNNLGRFGYKIKFYDSRVEGQVAVSDLIGAVKYFKKQEIDLLVIIRGGGSLESLQAFNNEMLIREVCDFPVPVIAGIGHDKDVPLICLAADLAPSTPTACARAINKSWEQAMSKIEILRRDLINGFSVNLSEKKEFIRQSSEIIKSYFEDFFEKFRKVQEGLARCAIQIGFALGQLKERLESFSRSLAAFNPERLLSLGYSILRQQGQVVKSIKQLEIGAQIDVQLQDGTLQASVNHKSSHQK